MKEIGGYFGLEPTDNSHHYHGACRVKNGRAALHYILTLVKPALVHLPYYTCDALLEPFKASGCNYRFYEINEKLEPKELPTLKEGEYFLYINYFGIKSDIAKQLSERYKDKLIVDATQAFFVTGNGVSWLFNSCRKFFGVPDGAYLYAPAGVKLFPPVERNEKYTLDHLFKRASGKTREGYPFFQHNEELMDCDITGMSAFSEGWLSTIDYSEVAKRRKENFDILIHWLHGLDLLCCVCDHHDVPMCYPLLARKEVNREQLAAQGIFIPTFWNEVLRRMPEGYEFEKHLASHLLPLPVDQRYTTDDMEYLALILENNPKKR